MSSSDAACSQEADAGGDNRTSPVPAAKAEGKPPERKRSRCQEKNRKAQARFRERQKLKGWETNKKLADLEASVQTLSEDKAVLASRAALLESQLQHAQLQAAAAQKDLQPPVHHQQHSSQLTLQPSLHHHPPPASGAIDISDGQVTWVGDRQRTGSHGYEVVLPTKEVTPMAWESYMAFYQDQIHQMAPLLSPAQADPTSQAAATCERLLQELTTANRAIFFRSPALRDKVHTQPLISQTEQPVAHPDVGLWRQVTAALQMTPQQRSHARDLWNYYWSRMHAIMAERRQLVLLMQSSCEVAVPKQDLMHSAPPTFHRNEDVAARHEKALEALQGLSKNIAEETLAQIEVGAGLFCKVLSPLQACSAYVGLYPYFPDKLAILSCVLELDEAEDAVRSLVNEITG